MNTDKRYDSVCIILVPKGSVKFYKQNSFFISHHIYYLVQVKDAVKEDKPTKGTRANC